MHTIQFQQMKKEEKKIKPRGERIKKIFYTERKDIGLVLGLQLYSELKGNSTISPIDFCINEKIK